jgi:hypothetical protein
LHPRFEKRDLYSRKELLEQQQKAKFLTDELEKPLNVHRWRKLECTDPETYELDSENSISTEETHSEN